MEQTKQILAANKSHISPKIYSPDMLNMPKIPKRRICQIDMHLERAAKSIQFADLIML